MRVRPIPDWALQEVSPSQDLSAKRGNGASKWKWICPKHGEYEQTYNSHIRGAGCPKCGASRGSSNRDKSTYSKMVETRRNNKPIPEWVLREVAPTQDINASRKMGNKWKWICPKHGEYEQMYADHVNGDGTRKCGCPRCVHHPVHSKAEKAVLEYIKSFYNGPIEENVRGVIRSDNGLYELDIYLPEKSIAIEYNGVYWHASKGGYKDKPYNYHLDKWLKCREKGIHLISIWDTDKYKDREDKILRMLKRQIIGYSETIYARKCDIIELPKKIAKEFVDKYHIQGFNNTSCNINYALVIGNKVYSVMSFGKRSYKQKDAEWELHRYTIREDCTVVGGAERLFNHFLKKCKPESVVSYSMNDWFSGGIYERLSFTNMGQCTPRYEWVSKKNISDIKSRESCQLKKLREKYPDILNRAVGNKEDYVMLELEYMKIYNSGNTKWLYK